MYVCNYAAALDLNAMLKNQIVWKGSAHNLFLDWLHLPYFGVAILPARDHSLVVQPHEPSDLRLGMGIYGQEIQLIAGRYHYWPN